MNKRLNAGHKKMKKYIAIIDYQMSNLYSVKHACQFIGLNVTVTSDKRTIESADAAILPGVGAFGDAMENLKKLGLVNTINSFVSSGKPFIGICLGMQLLFSESEEFGNHHGLGLIPGKVKRLSAGHATRVPHIGWNKIVKPEGSGEWKNPLLLGIPNETHVYFVHSYYAEPKDISIITSLTEYGDNVFCSSLTYNNIIATQFHPEKSSRAGVEMYKNIKRLIKHS